MFFDRRPKPNDPATLLINTSGRLSRVEVLLIHREKNGDLVCTTRESKEDLIIPKKMVYKEIKGWNIEVDQFERGRKKLIELEANQSSERKPKRIRNLGRSFF